MTTKADTMPTKTLIAQMTEHGLDWLGGILASLGVIGLGVLGGVARLLSDHPDEKQPISRRDIARYVTCSLLAGSTIAIFTFYQYGFSALLFGISGVAGFGSVQLLTFLVELMKKTLGKFFK